MWTFLSWNIEVNGWECSVEASGMEWGTIWQRVQLQQEDSVLVMTGAGQGLVLLAPLLAN